MARTAREIYLVHADADRDMFFSRRRGVGLHYRDWLVIQSHSK